MAYKILPTNELINQSRKGSACHSYPLILGFNVQLGSGYLTEQNINTYITLKRIFQNGH